MKDFRRISTAELWRGIEENARYAQKHTDWVMYLDNIKVLCALIDERIELFQRTMRTEQLIREGEANRRAHGCEMQGVSPPEAGTSKRGGDKA